MGSEAKAAAKEAGAKEAGAKEAGAKEAGAKEAGAKEGRVDPVALLKRASAEELLKIAAATALRVHPLVQKFNPQQTEELRKLILHEWKRHADFRGMVNRAVGVTPEPAKAKKPVQASPKAEKKSKKPDKEGAEPKKDK